MNGAAARRLYGMASAVVVAVAVVQSVQQFMAMRRVPLYFDDAYMFLRYAHNVRHGLGYSWNLDGVHTYGPTSLLWSGCTLLLSFLSVDAWTQLIAGSGLCSVAAVVAMAWAVAANAHTEAMRSALRVLPLVVLPLLGAPVFTGNQFTGMETMLAMALCALFAGMALLWMRGSVSSAALGAVAFLLLLARPESALVALLLPATLWLLHREARQPVRRLVHFYGVILGAAALEMLACRWYFGTPVPLSVYMKGGHAYLGYRGVWHPELLLTLFLSGMQVYLASWVLLARRQDRLLLLSFGLPLLAACVYLQTVTQIMGNAGRYYAPYLPLVLIPALLLLDRRLLDGDVPAEGKLQRRGAGVALMVLLLMLASSQEVQRRIRVAEGRTRDEYDAAQLVTGAKQPLPTISWQDMMLSITDDLVAPLPAGVTVAASEVGYLGERAGQVNIIDLAGLNDTAIALHGFHMADLLRRRPDLIWMPHTDYTYQRGVMLSDPDLLRQYDLYAGAANFGLAVRKDSPFHAAVERQLQSFWAKNYPGTLPSEYRVHAASWSGHRQVIRGE